MGLDAVFLRAAVAELQAQVVGLRIDKIFQPSRDRITLLLRGNVRLTLCASAGAPRVQLERTPADNPAAPPMFCMLLRKRLSGGRVAALVQPSLERLVRLEIDTLDELGFPGRHTLILEAIPRRANLILLDADNRIVDSLRRVDAEQSPERQVLPGLFYREPPPQNRVPFDAESPDAFADALQAADSQRPLERYLLERYFGLSPLLARELSFRARGDPDARVCDLDADARTRLYDAFRRLADALRDANFTPYLLTRDGQAFDFSCVPILQYGPAVGAVRFPDCSSLLDTFYGERERRERARVRGAELTRAATTARDRIRRKLRLQERDYADARDRDKWRVSGDLITANLYRMERGQASLTCENFYDDDAPVTIPLDPLLTPQRNAAKYYKRYARAKNAESALREQMDIARKDLDYLESVLDELERSETEQDFLEIRRELQESGFLRTPPKEKRVKKASKAAGRPWEYRTASGLRILVGRNNRQNDALTKSAERSDYWFHAQKIHGAHVILCTEGRAPSDADIRDAAALAAWRSQARESSNVPVDYTPVRYVKKPAGARPGMVIYTTYRTTYVTPAEPVSGGD